MTDRERGGALAGRAIAYAEAAIERVELPEAEALGELALAVARWHRDARRLQATEVSADDELDAAAREWSDTHHKLNHADMRAITKAIADAFVVGYQAGQDDIGRSERSLGGTAEDKRRRDRRDGVTPHNVRTERRERGGNEQHRAVCSCKWTSSWQPGPGAAKMAREAAATHARRMTHGSGR